MSGGARLDITGIVQGVGFRPFVFSLADRLGLTGWVRNTSAGVEIEVDGPPEMLQAFARAIREDAPPLAHIDALTVVYGPANGFEGFEIRGSESIPEAFQPVSPDVALCQDCLREMLDPQDRRYRYPFINCTNCGPRFTIILDVPYDRPSTTMAPFVMCPDCAREYADPRNRRFHAQPVACPACGPQVWLEGSPAAPDSQRVQGEAAIVETRRLIAAGTIVAIKGLGGFHLACDATNGKAVRELRTRKLRVDKPFAIMVPDVDAAEHYCWVSPSERSLLISAARPIVLLRRRGSDISQAVAPGQNRLGIMLPYTPLHHLLMERAASFPLALVMTSGNLSEEPIATENDEARQRLAGLADAFLLHDREIQVRCDDSVMQVVPAESPDEESRSEERAPEVFPLRRSRGYVPFPVKMPWAVPSVLAVGAELKNTFCITHGNYGFMSHHIGDLQNYETLRSFEAGIAHFEKLFRVRPEALACDLHPDYLATRYAQRRADMDQLPVVGVQHHHAHIASCMAEHGMDGTTPVIGVALDGTGYGSDGAIWGGELLVADYRDYRRALHLPYFPLPGGDAAIRHPARIALALLWSLGLEWDDRLAPVQDLAGDELRVLGQQMERRINAPFTSSMGRLFDAAASLAGIRQEVNYEAQAAIEFEAVVDPEETSAYPFHLEQGSLVVGAGIAALVADVLSGVVASKISGRFHNGVASMIAEAVSYLGSETGIEEVVLSGGVLAESHPNATHFVTFASGGLQGIYS